MSITLVTAWYNLKAKFDISDYRKWMDNMLLNVRCNIVIYTNRDSYGTVKPYINLRPGRIHIVIKELEDFSTYPLRDHWIRNHSRNLLLRDRVSWEVNMLWSEKVNFVYEAVRAGYFHSDWYCWCDIAYFRCGQWDSPLSSLKEWPCPYKVSDLDTNYIHYGAVCTKDTLTEIAGLIHNKNEVGLPKVGPPPGICTFAGGFFLIHRDRVDWWRCEYYRKLQLYFEHGSLVKDDQTILTDLILSEPAYFKIYMEQNPRYDNWFMFQRVLMPQARL